MFLLTVLTHMRKCDQDSKAFLGRVWLRSHFIARGVEVPVLESKPSLMSRDSVYSPKVWKPALSWWKNAKRRGWPKYFSNWFIVKKFLIRNCSLEKKNLICCYFIFNERYKSESFGNSPGWKEWKPNLSKVWVFRKSNKKCLALLLKVSF